MIVQRLAADIGVDPGDIEVVIGWITTDVKRLDDAGLDDAGLDDAGLDDAALDDAALDDAGLEEQLRGILDPAGQRTSRVRSACPECGRLPGPYLVLRGWRPCRCGGHQTSYCTADTGGCGHTHYEPELDPQRCTEPDFGFSG